MTWVEERSWTLVLFLVLNLIQRCEGVQPNFFFESLPGELHRHWIFEDKMAFGEGDIRHANMRGERGKMFGDHGHAIEMLPQEVALAVPPNLAPEIRDPSGNL